MKRLELLVRELPGSHDVATTHGTPLISSFSGRHFTIFWYTSRKMLINSLRINRTRQTASTKSLAQILRTFLWKGLESKKVMWLGVFLDTDSESPPWLKVKMLPWRVMVKKLLWSRDRLVKHEFDCFGLGLLYYTLGLWLGLGLG